MPDLITTADYLKAYSNGRISSSDAIEGIGLSGYRELLDTMASCGVRLPRGHGHEMQTAAEVEDVMPILAARLAEVAEPA